TTATLLPFPGLRLAAERWAVAAAGAAVGPGGSEILRGAETTSRLVGGPKTHGPFGKPGTKSRQDAQQIRGTGRSGKGRDGRIDSRAVPAAQADCLARKWRQRV